ncbi:hypothetical protein [Neptuniibacter sp. QD37_11]|uniref:hypothetical protein n=1 Tax=Neptuniibacter sp. QD37_11 TaxID=3398209 RepID=UPI0039F5B5CB
MTVEMKAQFDADTTGKSEREVLYLVKSTLTKMVHTSFEEMEIHPLHYLPLQPTFSLDPSELTHAQYFNIVVGFYGEQEDGCAHFKGKIFPNTLRQIQLGFIDSLDVGPLIGKKAVTLSIGAWGNASEIITRIGEALGSEYFLLDEHESSSEYAPVLPKEVKGAA